MKKIVCALLMTAFATPAFAGDLRSSMKRAATEAAQAPAPQAGPTENPYKIGALAMIAGGVGLAAYGFMHTTGVGVSSNTAGTSVTAKETHNTTLGIVGLGIAAAGGFVYALGQKKVSPQVSFSPRGATISGRWRW